MNRIFKIIATALSIIMAYSCQEREIHTQDISALMDDELYAIHTFSIGPDETVPTRSSLTTDTDEIKTICAFAFDAATGKLLLYKAGAGQNRPGDPVMIYAEGRTDFEWTLPVGVTMDIYAVCNIGKPEIPESLNDFLNSEALVYKVGSVSDMNEVGVPMTAVLKGISDNTGDRTYVLPAERIVSKYTLKMSGMPSGYRITGIRICNVSSTTTLFASNEAAQEASDLIMGDWATDEDLTSLNTGGRAEFYMFENAQTTSEGVALPSGSKWFEVHDKLGNATDLCTYLDIISQYNGNARRDRLYLGRDCITNFDVIRNTVRNITCPAPISVIPGAGQDALEFKEGVTIGPGQTMDLPFSYNLLLSGTDASSIEFTADAGITLGTPSFYPEDEYSGTGVIPVTCSESAAIGERLKVQMRAAEASAQTEIEVVNSVISVTISAPATTLYGNSMQLTAMAVYADGTTVTDPTEFVWSTSNAIALMDNGLLSRNGKNYGNVSVSAQYNGIMSNIVDIAISQYKVELLSVPDPVILSTGETVSCSITCSITNVTSGSVQKKIPELTASNFKMVSANPSVATGSLLGSNWINVKGISNGETALNLAYMDNSYGMLYLDLDVTVGDYSYALELSESSAIDMKTGGSLQIEAWYIQKYKGVEVSRTNVTDLTAWTSNRSSVASVSNGLVSAVSPGTCSIYATYNGYSDGVRINVTYPVEYEFVVTPEYVLLSPGEGKQFLAKLYTIIDGVRDSGNDVTDEVEWYSYDNSIVEIDDRGYATAVGEGYASISAEYYDYFSIVDVDVVDNNVYSNSLDVSPSSVSIRYGESFDLTATYYYYLNGHIDGIEDVTSSSGCVWSSSDESIAIVSGGTVIGLNEGTAIITADYGGYSSSCNVSVGSKPATYTYDLVVTASETSFTGGGHTVASAVYNIYIDGILADSEDVTSRASWVSSNTSVATVSNGLISVKDTDGNADITATYNGKSDHVTVSAAKKADIHSYSLSVSPSSSSGKEGKMAYFKAYLATMKNGIVQESVNVTDECEWSSSDDDLASHEDAGAFNLFNAGEVTVHAYYTAPDGSTVSASASLTIEPVEITYDLVISPSVASVYIQEDASFSLARKKYIDGTLVSTTDITDVADWNISDPRILQHKGAGLFSGISEGRATVTATYEGESVSATVIVIKKVTEKSIYIDLGPLSSSGTVKWTAEEPLKCNVYITLMWSDDLNESVDSICLSEGSSSGTISCGGNLRHLMGKNPDASFIISGGTTASNGITYTYILR